MRAVSIVVFLMVVIGISLTNYIREDLIHPEGIVHGSLGDIFDDQDELMLADRLVDSIIGQIELESDKKAVREEVKEIPKRILARSLLVDKVERAAEMGPDKVITNMEITINYVKAMKLELENIKTVLSTIVGELAILRRESERNFLEMSKIGAIVKELKSEAPVSKEIEQPKTTMPTPSESAPQRTKQQKDIGLRPRGVKLVKTGDAVKSEKADTNCVDDGCHDSLSLFASSGNTKVVLASGKTVEHEGVHTGLIMGSGNSLDVHQKKQEQGVDQTRYVSNTVGQGRTGSEN